MLSNSVGCAGPVAVASDLAITFSMYFFSVSVYEFTQHYAGESVLQSDLH